MVEDGGLDAVAGLGVGGVFEGTGEAGDQAVVGGEVFAELSHAASGPVVAFIHDLHVAAEAFPDEGGADDQAVAGEEVVPTLDVGVLGLAATVQAPSMQSGAERGAVVELDAGRVAAETEKKRVRTRGRGGEQIRSRAGEGYRR